MRLRPTASTWPCSAPAPWSATSGLALLAKRWNQCSAAVLGGIGNIKGALVGGVLLGFTQAFGQGYIASEYGIAYGFLVMIIVILFRPWGLYGQQEATRA